MVAMVALACGYILYYTSNDHAPLSHRPIRGGVAGAVCLGGAVVLVRAADCHVELAALAIVRRAGQGSARMDDTRIRSACICRASRYFNACEFFEAHEVWEELWKSYSGDCGCFIRG